MSKYKTEWELIEEYLFSLKDTIVYSFNDLIVQITNHLSYLKKEYGWKGDWLLSAATDRANDIINFMISHKDNYGFETYRSYEIKMYVCDKKINNIYTYNNNYYKCLDFDPKNKFYLWQPMTKILWFYIKKSDKEQFWMVGGCFDEV
jgi:hypothetical protein